MKHLKTYENYNTTDRLIEYINQNIDGEYTIFHRGEIIEVNDVYGSTYEEFHEKEFTIKYIQDWARKNLIKIENGEEPYEDGTSEKVLDRYKHICNFFLGLDENDFNIWHDNKDLNLL